LIIRPRTWQLLEKKSSSLECARASFRTLQRLARGCLRVDGKRETVDGNKEYNKQGDRGRRQSDVPAGLRAPLGVGDDSTRVELGVDGAGESAARALAAAGLVLLERGADAQKSQESNGNRGNEQKASNKEDGASKGHAQGKNSLVADGVQQEHSQNNSKSKRQNQGDEDKSLRELEGGEDAGVDRGLQVLVGLNGGNAAGVLCAGASADEVVHDGGGVEGGAADVGRSGCRGLQGEGVGPVEPRNSETRNHETEHHKGEGEGSAVLLLVD